MKAKHQRLVLVVIALLALIGAGLLAAWALRNQASYYYFPSQIVVENPPADRLVRLGGMVQEGSIETLADGVTVAFVVGDGEATVPVRFSGILPDLFVEGSGVVADGRYQPDGTFLAENMLAKHDENYVPREFQDMDEHQARDVIAETVEGS
ncbi:cytochrome c maturation protein CcmE [Parerythrobacter jejuensis]|uniref:Cytochrome c-type biogenesis protein CcmE n=1 Tax=Parerythrobacter jejuensis TaxID=795812 RepID=A0A845ASU2_9SPHN|nr:cytochrome c maturation protein CcmE [Parerythrobacter jejuensis]MXP32055.1 cytochrome c maturation protein CcmE [Parerythrobacter jejuensis]